MGPSHFFFPTPRPPSPFHPAPEEAAGGRASAPGRKVLIVEDEPLVARFMREIFSSRFDCEIDVVANGLAAFECLAQARYALVISDVRMPEMNGPELYLWVREASPATAEAFVFVTAYAEDRHFERTLAQWGVPIVAKPFTMDQLLAVCGPYLDGKRERPLR